MVGLGGGFLGAGLGGGAVVFGSSRFGSGLGPALGGLGGLGGRPCSRPGFCVSWTSVFIGWVPDSFLRFPGGALDASSIEADRRLFPVPDGPGTSMSRSESSYASSAIVIGNCFVFPFFEVGIWCCFAISIRGALVARFP